ncbi:MAG: diaminopimelate decarboxylase [Gemmatimonadota bacterium]
MIEPLLRDAGLTRDSAGELLMAGVRLADIARQVGTPAYVYNAEVIRAQYRRLDAAFAGIPHRICYAVKANGNLAVLRILRDLGAGADIVSIGELHRALAAGIAAGNVVFSGVGKTAVDLRAAIGLGVGQINVESLGELERLAAIARELGTRVAVGIRVNPDVTTDTHPYMATGSRADKFGVPLDQVMAAARLAAASPELELKALAMHVGSQIGDVDPYRAGLRRLLELREQLRAHGIGSIDTLDMGGGFGISYRGETPLAPERLAEAIGPLLENTGLTLAVEPGRSLVGSAGVLLTEVVYRKHNGGKEFIIVDAGMNDLLRPSHYEAHHEVVELTARERPTIVADLVGPVCETGDFLALGRALPAVEPGELLAVLGAGAYGFTMASNYNARPLPAEVLVDAGRWGVSRPRQRVEQLFASEEPEPLASASPQRS